MIYQVEKGHDPIISGNLVGHETIDISQMRNTKFVCNRRINSKLRPQNELNDKKLQCKTTLALSIKTAFVTFWPFTVYKSTDLVQLVNQQIISI